MSAESTPPSELKLVPPEPVLVVAPETAPALLPENAASDAVATQKADAFLARLDSIDPRSPELQRLAQDVATVGAAEVAASAKITARVLDRPRLLTSTELSRQAGPESVAATLAELREAVADLDPARARKVTGLRKLFSRGGEADFAARYGKAQDKIDRIVRTLYTGQERLRRANAKIHTERTRMWEVMTALSEDVSVLAELDRLLDTRIAEIRPVDPERATALTSELLYAVRQRRQDLLAHLAVCAQGYLALEVVRKNNEDLATGAERAATTTVSALRNAVMVAEATQDQQTVAGHVGALNNTTNDLLATTSTMLEGQAARPSLELSGPAVDPLTIGDSFAAIYRTLDQVDLYRMAAAENMNHTIDNLEVQLASFADRLGGTSNPEAGMR